MLWNISCIKYWWNGQQCPDIDNNQNVEEKQKKSAGKLILKGTERFFAVVKPSIRSWKGNSRLLFLLKWEKYKVSIIESIMLKIVPVVLIWSIAI